MSEVFRTPTARFEGLPDFPWEPSYADDLPGFDGLRMAWIDAGPPDADRVALCLHGEPTWSFLYRKMIPVFTAAGLRVVAPDFFGFGRSDKPVDEGWYSFDRHRRSVLALVERLDLQRITLVVQDWGGIIGLTLPLDIDARIERLLVMNTTLATGRAPSPGFLAWLDLIRRKPDLDIERLLGAAEPRLSPAERAAYAAPFPEVTSKAGVRTFPALVPIRPDMAGASTGRAALEHLRSWDRPSFMAIGMQDPVLSPEVMHALHRNIPGCPPPLELADAGHFVQEQGDVVARAALRAWKTHA